MHRNNPKKSKKSNSKLSRDLTFVFFSKYTILGTIMFFIMFSLRGTCDRETGYCSGGFPFDWLFRIEGLVSVDWTAMLINVLTYYALSVTLLLLMRLYANHKDAKLLINK